MTAIDLRVKRYGTTTPLPARRTLCAGPLSLILEDADLRYVRAGSAEVLRRLYVAVRGPNWETIPSVYSNMRIHVQPDAFDVTFDAENVGAGIDYAWHGAIHADAHGAVTYSMDGTARRTFPKNRIGFCVLHPMDCAGAPCIVRHGDGSQEQRAFPLQIAPHQPFLDFVALTHVVDPGLSVTVEMSGDVFEMEDQRNWTDASFKTYSTPLHLPYPVTVEAGTRIVQSVTLRLNGMAIPAVAPGVVATAVAVDIGRLPAGRLPQLGLGMASHGLPLADREIARLRALHLDHMRVDLDLADDAYIARFRQARQEAEALGAALEVALHLSGDAEQQLATFAERLPRRRPPIARWLVYHRGEQATPARWLRAARKHLGHYGAGITLGGGANAFFTQLNRNRPDFDALDVVCYALTPQVHAFDNSSLVETLAVQAVTLASARAFCADRPLVVSPVTLKMRVNPDATAPEPPPAPGELPSQVDPRQLALFAAGWTAGSLKHLAEGGAAAATYYETTGWRGVMECAAGSPLPDRFPSSPGMLFPLYHVFADAAAYAHAPVLPTASSDPLKVEALALCDGFRLRVLVANLSAELTVVQVNGLAADSASVRILDENTFERAAYSDPDGWRGESQMIHTAGGQLVLTLLPYAVATIDALSPG